MSWFVFPAQDSRHHEVNPHNLVLPNSKESMLAMTMVTNLRDFLDENGKIPELSKETMELLFFLGEIVEAASLAYYQPMTLAGEICRATIDGKKCEGEIEAWVCAESKDVAWMCLECGEEGIIRQWADTIWDLRIYILH